MSRQVRFFDSQIAKENEATEEKSGGKAKKEDLIRIVSMDEAEAGTILTTGPHGARAVDELEVTLAEHEARLNNMNSSYKSLTQRTKELVEARYVLRETAVFFDRVSFLHHLCVSAHSAQVIHEQSTIRASFDESAAPLLQHEEREAHTSTDAVHFDLE